MTDGRLFGVSDLHVAYAENRAIVEAIQPRSSSDWLLVAGDVGETVEDIKWALGIVKSRFEKVIWTPGNHELWTTRDDPVQLRGQHRYQHLVEVCRELGVVTPDDPFQIW